MTWSSSTFFRIFFVGKLIGCELRRGGLDSILPLRWHRGDATLRSFLSLLRIIQQDLRACSSFGIVWVETMASPPAAADGAISSRIGDCLSVLCCLLSRHSNRTTATVKKNKAARYSVDLPFVIGWVGGDFVGFNLL